MSNLLNVYSTHEVICRSFTIHSICIHNWNIIMYTINNFAKPTSPKSWAENWERLIQYNYITLRKESSNTKKKCNWVELLRQLPLWDSQINVHFPFSANSELSLRIAKSYIWDSAKIYRRGKCKWAHLHTRLVNRLLILLLCWLRDWVEMELPQGLVRILGVQWGDLLPQSNVWECIFFKNLIPVKELFSTLFNETNKYLYIKHNKTN